MEWGLPGVGRERKIDETLLVTERSSNRSESVTLGTTKVQKARKGNAACPYIYIFFSSCCPESSLSKDNLFQIAQDVSPVQRGLCARTGVKTRGDKSTSGQIISSVTHVQRVMISVGVAP